MRGSEPRRGSHLARWGACALLLVALAARAGELHVFSYHDVRERVAGNLDPDQFAVSTDHLVAHLEWLRAHDYRPVGIDDVIAARRGLRPLPERAVLLTFDDGYASVYHRVFPLLALYGYPAVVALVTSWMEAAPGTTVRYGDEEVPRERFLSWAQVREMQASGLVEIASHSHDLHRGVLANPQGNEMPAATTARLDPATARYETTPAYLARIRDDLARSRAIIARETGRAPRVMVWPFGEHNAAVATIARELGMPWTLTLSVDAARATALDRLPRRLLVGNPGTGALIEELSPAYVTRRSLRTVRVSLDAVYDPDPAREAERLDRLLDQVAALAPTTVLLDAHAAPASGAPVAAVYFPSRALALRRDLLSRVAWQLRTRTGVEAWAVLPSDGYPPGVDLPALVEDLARHAFVDGMAFAVDAGARGSEVPVSRLVEALRRHRPLAGSGLVVDVAALDLLPATGESAAVDRVIVTGVPADLDAAATGRLARRLGGLRSPVTRVVAEVVGLAERDDDGAALVRTLERLRLGGARHLGLRLDRPAAEWPAVATLRPALSAASHPYPR
ncbi:MAG: poly-beta-1,6-N-acetyl-D-glucosamine N-deacetylase PgaB [Ectothiorhodospiraceae bacterium]|nr:poly-beta-1,6-N-acetyl-D-glucosamine N-deacetylase PgaB [Ectothiorhodospiraceae bacterium]